MEIDLVLLATLRGVIDLLSRPEVARAIEDPEWARLKDLMPLLRSQVFVDEATDFSPIQLACMAHLAHPGIRSFFACGDFNQRLTAWGTRRVEDLRWVFPDIEVKEMAVTYRHTSQLSDLARALVQSVGGEQVNVALPDHVDSTGPRPALLEDASDAGTLVDWLAQRVREIERLVESLPSTAIFVNSEEEVRPLAAALNAALEDDNVRVEACPDGQVVGQDTDVRVFHVEHIKGLEFESVFFVGVDRLVALKPGLFDKYLYVGITRAATYLGVTCEGMLPHQIAGLRSHFGSDWSHQSG
jgi:DNA helicase IV